jgi:predicted MFS family arabinose efflux permease
MSSSNRMSPLELRASLALAGVFGLRLFGMFVILPVFAIYAETLPGANLTLAGIAIGAYGLTQAILQIPSGWMSDRYGRKPVIYGGLILFAVGSFVAATASDIYVVIAGRVLQGAGAISAAVMALAADLTREEHRTKAMAMIGSTIGLVFAMSLAAAPWLNQLIGVPGIFALTGVLAIAAMGVVWAVVPAVVDTPAARTSNLLADLKSVLADAQLLRLNFGIFALHAVLMALFIAVPFALRDAGMPLGEHWKIYLPVMLASFVLMLPAVMGAHVPGRLKRWFAASVALLLLVQIAMPWLLGSQSNVWAIALFLLIFFTPFNVLEAMLPSLVSRIAPAQLKGAAIGVYSSVQFFGAFAGAAAGAYLYSRWGVAGIVVPGAVVLAIWLILALGMREPPPRVKLAAGSVGATASPAAGEPAR